MNKWENIDVRIAQFLAGEALPEEAMDLEDWKREHPDNLAYYNQCAQLYAGTIQNTVSPEVNTDKAWQIIQSQLKTEVQIKTLPTKIAKPWRMAASVALVIGLSLTFVYVFKFKKAEQEKFTAQATALPLQLKDNSTVTLEPYSEIIVSSTFNKDQRTLYLKGSASFEVIHQAAKPFIVDVGQVFVKDIGTRFHIHQSQDTDTVYVRVDEGVVLLFDSLGNELEIKATQRALYVRSLKRIVLPSLPELNTNKGKLVFQSASLNEIITELTKRYGVSIKVENESLLACKLTTQFEQENIDLVLTVICETLGLSYEKKGTRYWIKGQACVQ